ncbi:hypothetical protein BO78DRAFT_72841 [Aspergillus sclerotiicarbonarius CBS 121057]|uniref:Uncharacterized protein n=1 Tax=Aspergillus sclerotiicarbonarius (strain CBS 121057 / IBT 28362) TaxID=1448318 RepID=A0A319EE59_ASPSB|nr:hypothetical protein BO78DRAFT_72841 [Aspergillus sclerotiicarbonarius CBS 121057]
MFPDCLCLPFLFCVETHTLLPPPFPSLFPLSFFLLPFWSFDFGSRSFLFVAVPSLRWCWRLTTASDVGLATRFNITDYIRPAAAVVVCSFVLRSIHTYRYIHTYTHTYLRTEFQVSPFPHPCVCG